jgi:hypothetical protein
VALGSSAGAIFVLVLREAVLLVGVGFVLGAVGALALNGPRESALDIHATAGP